MRKTNDFARWQTYTTMIRHIIRFLRIFNILSLKYFLVTKGRNLLVVVGVALGVALFVAVKTANISILRSFEKSINSVAGKADLSVYGNELGFPEDIYSVLVDYEGVSTAAPVLWRTGQLESAEGDVLFFHGVDVLIDPSIRNYSLADVEEAPEDILFKILSPGSILLTEKFAHRYGLEKGDRASFVVDDRIWELEIAGLLQSTGTGTLLGGNLAVVDISFAQSLFHTPGMLDRIDLVLEKGVSPTIVKKELKKILPSYLFVDFPEQRGESVRELLASFQLNLEVLSLIALLVGMFLLYNMVSYSVVTRREMIGIVRAEGCSRVLILLVFLCEIFLLSGLGSFAGMYLGIEFASKAISLMSSTISSLYLITRVEEIEVPARLFIMGVGGGVGASLFSAFFPAKNAAFYPPVQAITKGSYEIRKTGQTKAFIFLALVLFLLAVGITLLPTSSPLPGYLSSLFVILGMSSLVLPLITLLHAPMSKFFSRFGVCIRVGVNSFFNHKGRNSVALAALATAVSMVVSIVIMVESFRSTVTVWLDQTLKADIFITMESRFKRGGTEKMSPDIVDKIKDLPFVQSIDPFRYINIEYERQMAALGVLDFSTVSQYNSLPVKKGVTPFLKAKAYNGVVISEGFATIYQKDVGDTLLLSTPMGDARFTIYGIYYDYAVQYGIILFDQDTFA
ncbi:MAG: ABC transporter permease, partial [Thermodesulfobacteriota bacterium]|nr:ABC transporter permease [Thermodesulfobacteriota bacterium]